MWNQLNSKWIQHKLHINRCLQRNILLEIVKTRSLLSKEDLQHALRGSVNRFESTDFLAFLNQNNSAMIFTDSEMNEEVDCEEILQKPNFKTKIQCILDRLPDDQTFSFIHKKPENQESFN